MNSATQLLLFGFVEKTLRRLISERDCFYDGCSTPDGHINDHDDRQVLAAMDADIDEAQHMLDIMLGKEESE